MWLQLGVKEARSAALGAMAAAQTALADKRVDVLIPPQAATWLQVSAPHQPWLVLPWLIAQPLSSNDAKLAVKCDKKKHGGYWPGGSFDQHGFYSACSLYSSLHTSSSACMHFQENMRQVDLTCLFRPSP